LTSKEPVHIRRNVQDDHDPYIDDEQLAHNSVCKECGRVYTAGRWYFKDQIAEKNASNNQRRDVVCPACRKQRDHVPGGVIKITGGFFDNHREEILNLIRHEEAKAMADNPLERIMAMGSNGNAFEIETTNEKLAQRIGKALHKAYDGRIEYKWSADTKLTRVNWHRDI
jgi:NMD protein affecting ribosome stability and mRNA decay